MMGDDVFDVLSYETLLEKVIELAKRERRMTLNVVMHLGEVERRRLFLGAGYGSMYDYYMRKLGYFESSTYRRLATARCIRKFPEVGKLIRENELTIVTAPKVASVLTASTKDDLLRAVSGRSQAEVDRIVAGYKTGKPIHDRIKPIVVECPSIPLAMESNPSKLGESPHHSEGTSARRMYVGESNDAPKPERETCYEVTIAADEEFMELYR